MLMPTLFDRDFFNDFFDDPFFGRYEKDGKEDEQPQSSEPDEDRCQRNCGRLRDES